MKKFFIIILCAVFLGADTKAEGITFTEEKSWQDVLARAKAENKFIFVDCYTTWCGPCKTLKKEIFPDKELGKLMNEKFINIEVQMDRTSSDDEKIKKWYVDSERLQQSYMVAAFPTLLFFSPDGVLVHRTNGIGDVQALIMNANLALHPSGAYIDLRRRYESGNRDTAIMKNLALASADMDPDFAHKVANEYIATMSNMLTKENISFLSDRRFTKKLSDRGFELYNQYPHEVAAVMGDHKYYAIDNAAAIIISNEEILITTAGMNDSEPDWKSISKDLKSKYHKDIVDKLMLQFKRSYYEKNKHWPEYCQTAIEYKKKYYAEETFTRGTNIVAWNIFLHSNNAKELETVLNWVQNVIVYGTKDHYIMDTYANLLYKLNRKELAIFCEEQALLLLPEGQRRLKKTYQDRIDKMKNGEKTWE